MYVDFNKPFELEIDASMSKLGAVLTQWDDNGYSRVIIYANHSLQPNRENMHNYSSEKMELLGFNEPWPKKYNILLGSCFAIWKDNSPLIYVQESKSSAVQVCWLCELIPFNSNIKYWRLKTTKGPVVNLNIPLSQIHPQTVTLRRKNIHILWYASS